MERSSCKFVFDRLDLPELSDPHSLRDWEPPPSRVMSLLIFGTLPPRDPHPIETLTLSRARDAMELVNFGLFSSMALGCPEWAIAIPVASLQLTTIPRKKFPLQF